MTFRAYILITVLIISIISIIYLETLNTAELVHQKRVAEVMQPFSLSFGALVAAIGGFGLISEWLKRRKDSDDSIEYWRRRFPIQNLDSKNGFRFIDRVGSEGVIYVHDKKNNKKHWISNLVSMRKIWGPNFNRDTLQPPEFDDIPTAENIDIT